MKNIGFVFQSYNLIPVLTAKENVEFIMSLQIFYFNDFHDIFVLMIIIPF
jgi:ABC-type lipoprotein export system ATPase subunit